MHICICRRSLLYVLASVRVCQCDVQNHSLLAAVGRPPRRCSPRRRTVATPRRRCRSRWTATLSTISLLLSSPALDVRLLTALQVLQVLPVGPGVVCWFAPWMPDSVRNPELGNLAFTFCFHNMWGNLAGTAQRREQRLFRKTRKPCSHPYSLLFNPPLNPLTRTRSCASQLAR